MKKILFPFCLMTFIVTVMSCESNQSKMTDLAKEDILSSLPYPDSTAIIDAAPCDSAFGLYYFTEDELIDILTEMEKVSNVIMEASTSLMEMDESNNPLINLTERHMEAATALRYVMMNSQEKGEFTGWKMKVVYESVDKDHHHYRCARWLFFNKEGNRVIKAFDIPLI